MKCKICGSEDEHNVNPDSFIDGVLRSKMIKEGCCFSCAFWLNKIDTKDDNTIIVGHSHYTYNEPVDLRTTRGFLGFGGHNFYIQKTNGELLHTNNMWHQGDIPAIFQDRLANNAKFITEEEYNKLKNN